MFIRVKTFLQKEENSEIKVKEYLIKSISNPEKETLDLFDILVPWSQKTKGG